MLTPAGEDVHADVTRLEHGFLSVERRLAGADARPEGLVRLATTETFATSFLVERLLPLRVAYPRIVLELLTGNTPVDLARREADVGIRIGQLPKQPYLITRNLGAASFGLFASSRYVAQRGRPRVRDGLQGHDVIAYSGRLAAAPLGRWLDANVQRAEVVMRSDSVDVVYKAVATGLGVGVLPYVFASHGLELIHADVLGNAPITSVVHEDQARSARIRAVVQYLADIIHRDRSLLAGAKRNQVRSRAK